MTTVTCPSCRNERDPNLMHPPETIIPKIAAMLEDHKDHWSTDQAACEVCINEMRAEEAEDMLEAEMGGELTPLEREVIESMRRDGLLSQNIAENDYRFTLKSDLEIRYINAKLDHILHQQSGGNHHNMRDRADWVG